MARMVDTLRLEVVPLPRLGFQIKAYINEADLLAAADLAGMDPYNVLIPVNRLVATPQPQKVTIGRCYNGDPDCVRMDVVVHRRGDLVHWTWSCSRAPFDGAAAFAAEAYAAEVGRMAADQSWEPPGRTAGRLVVTRLMRERLLPDGVITTHMIHKRVSEPVVFFIALEIRDEYQLFLEFPWHEGDPGRVADEVCAILAGPTAQWPASWFSMKGVDTPPAIAGPSWQREAP